MEYRLEIPTVGRGALLLNLLRKRLPGLDPRIFTFGEPKLGDHSVIVEFDLDEEAAARWCIQRVFILSNIDLQALGTGMNLVRLAQKVQDRREAKKEAAPKRATRKKAAPKKKAASKKKAAKK